MTDYNKVKNLHNKYDNKIWISFCFFFFANSVNDFLLNKKVKNRIYLNAGPEVIKTFFMLNSTEHEISLGHKNKNTKTLKKFHAQFSWGCSAELSMKEVSKFCQ